MKLLLSLALARQGVHKNPEEIISPVMIVQGRRVDVQRASEEGKKKILVYSLCKEYECVFMRVFFSF